MKIIEINEGLKKKIPVCWEESTLGFFQNIMRNFKDGDSLIHLFSIMVDEPFTKIEESSSEDLDAAIYVYTAFVLKQERDFLKLPCPKSFRYKKHLILKPTTRNLTVAQSFQLRLAMKDAPNLECIVSRALAIYIQPIVSGGKFDIEEAKLIEQDLLQMNVYDVYPFAFFLLNKFSSSGNFGLAFWFHRKLMMMKRSRKLRAFLFSLLCMTSASLTSMLPGMDNSLQSWSSSSSMISFPTSCSGSSNMTSKFGSTKKRNADNLHHRQNDFN